MKSFFRLTRYFIAFYFMLTGNAAAEEWVWKTTIVSALPAKTGIPAEFCREFAPDTYTGSFEHLLQESVKANNGLEVKYRSVNVDQKNGLYFKEIYAFLHRRLTENQSWNTNLYIHLQQLNPNGVADGVWITPECKGRLIIEPLKKNF